MRSRHLLSIFALALCGLLTCGAIALSADEAPRGQDERAIRAAAKQYMQALERNDARAMHDLWVAEGDIVDEFGHARSAHEVIDHEVQDRVADAIGDSASSTVNVIDSSIRFLTSEVAIEDGSVEVANGAGGPRSLRGRFTAVWVKQDDKWRLASLRETRVPRTTARDLEGLGWMVGDWTGQIGKATFDVTAHWNAKHTLLKRDLTVTHDGKVILSGEQRIGVDPLDGQIKSWMHDSEGGHGEGVWTKHGDDTWVVQATGVTPDGRRTLATNVYTHHAKDQITWKSTGGFSDGLAVPDFEITLKRNAAGEQQETQQPDGRNP